MFHSESDHSRDMFDAEPVELSSCVHACLGYIF